MDTHKEQALRGSLGGPLAVLLGVCLVGCVPPTAKPKATNYHSVHATLLKKGHSKPYADGYVNGWSCCKQGTGRSGLLLDKNEITYLNNRDYIKGWQKGYRVCHAREQAKKAELAPPKTIDEKMRHMWDDLKK